MDDVAPATRPSTIDRSSFTGRAPSRTASATDPP